ncbi:MAG: FAD-binding oxidoreductase, partial [Thermodesulfobacteriota bacterium]
MGTNSRKFWGWGIEEADLTPEEREDLVKRIEKQFDLSGLETEAPPRLEEIDLPRSKINPPDTLSDIFSSEPYDRAGHTYGKAFPDIVRAYKRDFSIAPDLVAFPRSEQEITDILDWCSSQVVAAIPYGAGSSVVKGTEPDVGDGYKGVVTIDLKNLDQVLEIDKISRAANIQSGIYGPALENALRPNGLTLRHFPQSFEYSTLGGWIATRSGGHFATLYT